MSTYANRPTRFNLNVPVAFKADGEVARGQTVNVSASGLLVTFQGYIELWVTGELSLFVDDYQLTLKAKVARAHGRDTGMAFLVASDNDRRAVQILIDYASSIMKPGEYVRADL